MDETRVRELVAAMDTTDARAADAAWDQVKPLGAAVVPYLAEAYARTRTWQGRTALVFHAIRHARTNDTALRLGIAALADRSHMPRHRACGLLAYSLRAEALEPLRTLLAHKDGRTVEDAKAAIDAIHNRNHHLFVDRMHTGRARWIVNPEDNTG